MREAARMPRWTRAASVVLLLLLVSALTGLYDALPGAETEDLVVLVVALLACLGLGLVERRLHVLLAPVAFCAVTAGLGASEGAGWFVVVVVLPILLVATAGGLALGRLLGRRAAPAAAVLAAVGAAAALWGVATSIERARASRLPVAVQREIERGLHLVNLCPSSETAPEGRPPFEAAARALVREVRRRPDWLVTRTVSYSHGDDERETWTVAELARDELELLEEAGPRCEARLQQALRDAL